VEPKLFASVVHQKLDSAILMREVDKLYSNITRK